MDDRSFRFRIEQDGTVIRVDLDGQLGFAAGPAFETLLSEIVERRPSRVLFDLSHLNHIDSVGLGLLYIAREDLGTRGVTIVLTDPRDNVARMLELTEATKAFEITRNTGPREEGDGEWR